MKKWLKPILFFIIFLLSYRLLAYNLDYHSIWYDESVTYEIVTADTPAHVVQTALEKRPYPPLYFLLSHEIYKRIPTTYGLRALSPFFGALTAAVLFLLAAEMFSIPVAVVSVIIFIMMPNVSFHGRDANPYTMMMFFTTLAALCLYRVTIRPGLLCWAGFTLASFLAIGTHAIAMFFTLGLLIIAFLLLEPWFVFSRTDFPGKLKAWIYRARYLIISALILAVCIGLWSWYFKTQTAWDSYYRDQGGDKPLTFLSIFEPYSLKVLRENLKAYFRNWMVAALFFSGLVSAFIVNRRSFIFLISCLLIPITCIILFLLMTYPTHVTRYNMSVAPFFALAMGVSMTAGIGWPFRFRGARILKGLIFLAVLALLGTHIYRYGYVTRYSWLHPGSESWDQVAAILKAQGAEGDVVLIRKPNMETPLRYYYKGDIEIIKMPEHVPSQDELNQIIFNNLLGKRRVWLVQSHVLWNDGFEQMVDRFEARIYLDQAGNFQELRLAPIARIPLYSIRVVLYNILTRSSGGLKDRRS